MPDLESRENLGKKAAERDASAVEQLKKDMEGYRRGEDGHSQEELLESVNL